MFLNVFVDFYNSILINIDDFVKIIFKAILIIIIGYFIIKFLKRFIRLVLKKSKLDNIIISFVMSIFTCILYVIYVFVIASVFRVPTTSLAAIIASSGVAIGLALKDSLSSIANGLVILVTKPFKEGDFINVDGQEGDVIAINMITTVLLTPDNKRIIIPNTTVTSSNIINYESNSTRRLDFDFNISYKYDTSIVKKVIEDAVKKNKLILKTPKHSIFVLSNNNNGLIYSCRVWVKTEQHWSLKIELLEQIVNNLKQNNIEITVNKLDVKIENV